MLDTRQVSRTRVFASTLPRASIVLPDGVITGSSPGPGSQRPRRKDSTVPDTGDTASSPHFPPRGTAGPT